MEPKIAQFINKGMQQDYSISKASNEFAFKNHNIRITTRGENSLLTVTNEKSNKALLPKEKEIVEHIVSKGVKEFKYNIIRKYDQACLDIPYSGDTIKLTKPLYFVVFSPIQGIHVIKVDKLNGKPIRLGLKYKEDLVVVLAHNIDNGTLVGYLDNEEDASTVDQVFKHYGCRDSNDRYNIECFLPTDKSNTISPDLSNKYTIYLTKGTTTSGYYKGVIPEFVVRKFKFVYNSSYDYHNTLVTNTTSIAIPKNALRNNIYLGAYYDADDKYDLIFKNVGIFGNQESEPIIQREEILHNTELPGVVLGVCNTKDSIILFTKDVNYDYIISISHNDSEDTFTFNTLYRGNLKFSLDHPIETLYNYESNTVEKIYWVDGINQPRLINIKGIIKEGLDTQFDFNPIIENEPFVQVEKIYSGDGLFKPGVIQYLITYYNNYAQETAPVYISPLYYISEENRGVSVNDTVSNSFIVKCSNIDNNWDNIVLYSLHRSSKDSTVLGYKVKEHSLLNLDEDAEIMFVDNGANLEAIDPSKFFFENDSFIPGTLSKKADKIFFGDLKTKDDISDLTFVLKDESKLSFVYDSMRDYPSEGGLYDYKNQLVEGEHKIKTFKGGEKYRFALQLQDNKGIWSSPLYIGDLTNDLYPKIDGNVFKVSKINYTNSTSDLRDKIPNFEDYVRCRLLMAETSDVDRTVVAQGIISPTIYNMNEVYSNTCHYINSWIQRFTCSSRHLQNVNAGSTYNDSIVDITGIETPLEKGETNYLLTYYDITSESENTEIDDTSIPNSAVLTNVLVTGSITKRYWDSITQLVNVGVKNFIVTVNIYSSKGNLLDTKNILFHDNDNYSGNMSIGTYPTSKSISKQLDTFYDKILNLSTLKFSHKYYDADKQVTTTYIDKIKESIGDVKILNLPEDDYIYPTYKDDVPSFIDVVNIIKDGALDLDWPLFSGVYYYTPVNVSEIVQLQENSRNQYFIDANTFSFYSPDIKNTNYSDLKFRIVGCAKLRHNISDYQLKIDNQKGTIVQLPFNMNKDDRYLKSHYLYHITNFDKTSNEGSPKTTGSIVMPLWNKSGQLSNNEIENVLKRKVIGNLWYCDSNYYADDNTVKILWEKNENSHIKHANSSTIALKSKIYKKDYENLLIPINKYGFGHLIQENAQPYTDIKDLESGICTWYNDDFRNSCLIKYNSEDHIVVQLPNSITLPGYRNNSLTQAPIRISTGEPIIGIPEERFLPYPMQYEVTAFDSEPPETIQANIYNNNKISTTIPNECKVAFIFWTLNELIFYDNNLPNEEAYPSGGTALADYLRESTLIKRSAKEEDSYCYNFLKWLFTDPNTKDTKRIVIYQNNTGETITKNDYGTLNCISSFLSLSEFISQFDNVGVYQINGGYELPYTNLGFTSALRCNSGIASFYKIELPAFIYNINAPTFNPQSDSFVNSINYQYWYSHPCVWIGELYRDNPNAYGGTSNTSVYNTSFIVCGDTVDINHDDETISVDGTIGDTYFQRWDCLRTYPTTEEDPNSIIDVVSTMVETHINIDGRYDSNRGRSDIANIRPSNINLINTAYTQSNNFFTYKALDPRNINKYLSNYYTWSLSKVNNELIDNWTKGLMVNAEMVDGAKGKITKLQLWKDYLLVFQERGIARIHYNDQTTMTSIEGIPVEIANSTTVSGHNYLSEAVGCHNKWSIVPTESGIYFVDSINKSINIFNGNVVNLSYNKSFKDWGTKNLNATVWSPNNLDGYYASFDFKNRDYYLTNNKQCLCFSEELQSFSSFYDYNKSPIMFNFKDSFIGIQFKNNSTCLWEQFAGDDYCNFYGEQKDYSVEYNINTDPISDKVFTNLEYRAYVDNSDDTFDKLEVSNEYQHGESNPNRRTRHTYPNAERKFRIWRTDIPRDTNSRRGLDRIRSPWMKLKLTKNTNTNNKMNFHDLLVKYYE